MRLGLRRYGFDRLLDSFKASGPPLSLVVENLCISSLCGNYSMNDWDGYLSRSDLRREFFCGTHDIRRWTLNRGLGLLGVYLEEVVDHLTKVCRAIDPDGPTHAYVDGSHIRRYGSKGSKVRYGEGGGLCSSRNSSWWRPM